MSSPRRSPRPLRAGTTVRSLAAFSLLTAASATVAIGVPPAMTSGRLEAKDDHQVPPPSFEDVRPEPAPEGFASLHLGTLAALVEGDPFTLPTGDGLGILMRLDGQGQFPDGTRTFTFSGDPALGSDAGATASIAVKDGLAGGFVRPWSGATVALRPVAPGILSIHVDGEARDCGGAVAPEAGPDEGGVAESCGDSPLFQDVLVVYNQAAVNALGSAAAVEIAIDAAIATGNQSLKNSQLGNRLRVVHRQLVNFPAQATAGPQLAEMASGPGGAQIRALRDQHGADLVQLVTTFSDACGLAYLFTGSSGSGFSTVAADCLGEYTPIHEYGHNYGCCHASGDGGGCNGGGYYPFSLGYRFTGASGILRRTIMAYSPGERIGYFSNPYQQFDGRPLGQLTPPVTDNARTIALTAVSVSNFRCSLVGAPDCQPNGVPDPVDILDGTSQDCNVNQIPDECEGTVECPPAQQVLFPSDPDAQRILDAFGTSLDIGQRPTPPDTSPYLGAGAFGDDATAVNSGAAFVWRLVGSGWRQEAKLKSPTPKSNSFFGWALAAHRRAAQVAPLPVVPERSFLAVGAYRQPGGTDAAPLASQGAVYVFGRSESTPVGEWPLARTVRPNDGLANAAYGFSVDMTRVNADLDDLLIVGAPLSANRGAVFVQRIPTIDTGNLPLPRKLIFQFAPDGAEYGWCVAVDPYVVDPVTPADNARRRAVLVVGAPGYGEDAGRIKCHERTLSANALFNASGFTVGLPTADSFPGDRFGEAVAISDNLIAVGAPGRDAGRGEVFIFRRTALNAYALAQSISLGADAAEGDRFGASVSLQPEANGSMTLLVGAPRRDVEVELTGGSTVTRVDAGTVTIYRMAAGSTAFSAVRTESAFDARTGDQFGLSLLQRPAERWIGAPFNDDQGLNSGKAYLLSDPVTP